MAFKFQVIRKMRGTGVALLEVNDPGAPAGLNWCVAQESNLVISLRYETDFDWALPISEPRTYIVPYISFRKLIFVKFGSWK